MAALVSPAQDNWISTETTINDLFKIDFRTNFHFPEFNNCGHFAAGIPGIAFSSGVYNTVFKVPAVKTPAEPITELAGDCIYLLKIKDSYEIKSSIIIIPLQGLISSDCSLIQN